MTAAGQPLASALDAAEMLTARGWVVFPADHPDAATHCTGSARRCIERRCGAADDPRKRGKHPRVERWGGLGVASTTQLAAWFGDPGYPANVALACGPSGIMVIDEDTDGALSAYAASIGEAVPATFRVRTGRGWHWYFLVPVDPATGERYRIGNSPGALGGWHCDVRGGASASAEHGGYVITAGSRHWSGITYTADEPYAAAVESPLWLIAAVLSPYVGPAGNGAAPVDGGEADRGGDRGSRSGATVPRTGGSPQVARWDKSPRYGSRAELWAQYRRHCSEVVHIGGEFRHELFRAARDGWRLVGLGLHDEEIMLDELAACVARVWHSEPDDRDAKIVYEEALDGPSGAIASPWELSEPLDRRPAEIEPGHLFTRPGEVLSGALTSGDHPSVPPVNGQHAVEGVTEGERLDLPPSTGDPDLDLEIKRVARQRLAREIIDAHALPVLVPKSWAEFRATPRPSYLVPRMLYRNGLAVVFGAPGSGKSFVVLDIALALATAREWQGHKLTGRDGGPGIVHYIMAEGVDINLIRADAWTHHHQVPDSEVEGHFVTIEEGVTLTDPGITQYLPVVTHGRPDLIILDTKNALFMGKESQGEDLGAMIRVLNRLRRAAGGCAIILIDHSGLGDKERARGSNAQQAGVHTEIMVTLDDETGLYTALVKRDKAAGPRAARWHWRLQAVPGVPHAEDMDTPAVCVPADPEAYRPFTIDGTWYTDMRPLHEKVAKLTGRGQRMALAIVRILRWVNSRDGLTKTDLKAAILAAGQPYDRTQVGRAVSLLEEHEIIAHPPKTVTRWVLVPPYDEAGE